MKKTKLGISSAWTKETPETGIYPPLLEQGDWEKKIRFLSTDADQHDKEQIIKMVHHLLTQREAAVRERIKKSVMEIVIKESKLGCVCDYKLASYFASLTPNKENL